MDFLKKRWLKWQLKRLHKGDSQAMARVYRVRDPWGLDVPSEHLRFKETTQMIRDRMGDRLGSILEIGCGEGLQTEYLAPLAERIVGIDPSQHAVKRARSLNISNAAFEVGDLLNFHAIEHNGPFDLVTACEVIYYLEDSQLERAFQNLNSLGRTCVVTYYQGMFARLDPFFKNKPVKSEALRTELGEWRFIWWKSTNHHEKENPALCATAANK
jgi:2-polyprenyl-3-methyl-5-hydroxy-6-metoxy-1,4-benzoquinol methylase